MVRPIVGAAPGPGGALAPNPKHLPVLCFGCNLPSSHGSEMQASATAGVQFDAGVACLVPVLRLSESELRLKLTFWKRKQKESGRVG